MRFLSNLPSFVSGLMIKLGSLPGLGFLQNWVFSARAMKYQFGDHAEDYEVYLMVGQDVVDDLKGTSKEPSSAPDSSGPGHEADVYDDYEYGDTSSAYHPVDDYPAGDEHHRYYDDDYRAS